MITVIYTDQFTKKIKKFLQKNPEMKSRVRKTIDLIEANIYHPSLRLHALKGKHQNIHSISINMEYRITLVLKITKNECILISIGTHDEVYN